MPQPLKIAVKYSWHPRSIPSANLLCRADLHGDPVVPLVEVRMRCSIQPFRTVTVRPVREGENFRQRLLQASISLACLNIRM